MTKQIIRSKIITTPATTEILNFNWGIQKGGESKNKSGIRSGATDDEKKSNRQMILRRNKSLLRRLMNANMGQYKEVDKFMTLTFRTDVLEVKKADKELTDFMKRLKYHTQVDFEYLGVREKQNKYNRGAIHYHIVFFGLPFVPFKQLLMIWNKGNEYMDESNASGLNIKGLHEKGSDDLSGFETITTYMSKYFMKQLEEDDFLKGHKTIIKSHGLKKPVEQEFEQEIDVEHCSFGITFLENRITYYKF